MVKRLVWPILTIFLVRNQLSPTEIGIVFAVGVLIGLILEVPSGAIADRIGRKTCLIISMLGCAASMFLFWLSHGFWGFLIANALYWAAGSLWTGTHNALIYETLKELGRSHDIKKVFGMAVFISQITTGVLFIAVPFIAKYSLSLPFLLNAIVYVGACILTTTLVEPQRSTSVKEKEVGKNFLGFKTFLTHKVLLSTGLFFGFIGGINGIMEDYRQVYLDAIHIDIIYFGLIYCALRILVGVLGAYSYRIEKAIGTKATLLLIPATSLLAYAGLAIFNSYYGLLFIVLDGVQAGLTAPLEQEYLNRVINDSQRATQLSIFNLLEHLIRAGATFIGGVAIDFGGVNFGFLIATIIFIICAPLLLMNFIKRMKFS